MKSLKRSKFQDTTTWHPAANDVPATALSGRWDGYYTQHDSIRFISAEFTQSGPKLMGFMNDACTTIEGSVSDLVLEQQLPPGTDERIVARIRSMCPGLDRFPVKTLVEIPPLSTILGHVEQTRIEFVKTYRGAFFAGYQVGDRQIGLRGIDQEVVYQGFLNSAGTEINGRWQVAGILKAGSFSHRSNGSFVLKRISPSGPASPLGTRN